MKKRIPAIALAAILVLLVVAPLLLTSEPYALVAHDNELEGMSVPDRERNVVLADSDLFQIIPGQGSEVVIDEGQQLMLSWKIIWYDQSGYGYYGIYDKHGQSVQNGFTEYIYGGDLIFYVFQPQSVGKHWFTFSVADMEGDTESDMVRVTVNSIPDQPAWVFSPTDQVIAYGDPFDYQLAVVDSSGIQGWWINDTEHFELGATYYYEGSTARLTDKDTLDPGVYGLEVVVTDLDGNTLSAEFSVTVLEEEVAGVLSWNNPPSDQTPLYNQPFDYTLIVTSSSGVAGWWLSDMVNFDITAYYYGSDSTCRIRNKTTLAPGEYGLLVVVTDNDGQTLLGTFTVTVDKSRLTNNYLDDTDPQIHNGMVTWKGFDGHDNEIFLYDGASVVQLTNNEFDDERPQIHNGMVTWRGFDGHDYEIFLHDGVSMVQLTNNEVEDRRPQIHNGMVAWAGSDGHDMEIFLYDGVSVLNISANQDSDLGYHGWGPKIHNGMVTWPRPRPEGDSYDIFLYDGTSVIQITNTADIHELNPQIHDGMVAFEGWDGNDLEIFFYDGVSVVQIIDNEFDDMNPQIQNGMVIWSGFDGHDNEIFLYDGISVTNVSANGLSDYGPQIDNGMFTWFVWDIYDYEIVFYDGTSVIQITDDDFLNNLPQIHNGMVTWQSWDGNDYEVFLWSPEPEVVEPQQLDLKLSGEFDFLLKEEIHFQLAALLTDTYTGVPISGATVTFDIYDPDGVILVSGTLVEDAANPGVYIYVMADTMKNLKLPKGIYLVYAIATLPDGAQAVDMVQFHIDPPGETLGDPFLSFAPLGLGAVAVLGVSIAGFLVRRNRRLLKSARGKGE